MMTEQEATTKWCPFAKRAVYASAKEHEEISMRGIDPDYADEMAAMFPCIGSACMAWRIEMADAGTHPIALELEPTGRGYCGLAGKP